MRKRTPQQVRECIRRGGINMSDLARQWGVPRSMLSRLLSGELKGLRGKAHRAAVLLGLKHGAVDIGAKPIC